MFDQKVAGKLRAPEKSTVPATRKALGFVQPSARLTRESVPTKEGRLLQKVRPLERTPQPTATLEPTGEQTTGEDFTDTQQRAAKRRGIGDVRFIATQIAKAAQARKAAKEAARSSTRTGQAKVSFTPRKLNEAPKPEKPAAPIRVPPGQFPLRERDETEPPVKIPGPLDDEFSQYSEFSPEIKGRAHRSVVGDLKKEIAKAQLERQAMLDKAAAADAPLEEGIDTPEEELPGMEPEGPANPLIPAPKDVQFGTSAPFIKKYSKLSRLDPEAAERVKAFIQSNPEILGPHVVESNAAQMANRKMLEGKKVKEKFTKTAHLPLMPEGTPIDESLHEDDDRRPPMERPYLSQAESETRPRTGFGDVEPGEEAPIVNPVANAAIDARFVRPSPVVPDYRPHLSFTTKAKVPPSEFGAKAKQLAAQGFGKRQIQKLLLEGETSGRVRRYKLGGEAALRPPKVQSTQKTKEAPPKPKATGYTGGDVRFEPIETVKKYEYTPAPKPPKILVADELFSGVDRPSEKALTQKIRDTKKDPTRRAKALQQTRERGKSSLETGRLAGTIKSMEEAGRVKTRKQEEELRQKLLLEEQRKKFLEREAKRG
jgi:hypothetical protein